MQGLRLDWASDLSSVDGQGLRDGEEGVCELCDGQLFPGAQRGGKALQVDGESSLHSTPACHTQLVLTVQAYLMAPGACVWEAAQSMM